MELLKTDYYDTWLLNSAKYPVNGKCNQLMTFTQRDFPVCMGSQWLLSTWQRKFKSWFESYSTSRKSFWKSCGISGLWKSSQSSFDKRG